MKTVEMIKAVEMKMSEMELLLDELLKSDVSENTKRTQKFQRTKAIHDMAVLNTILHQCVGDEVGFTEEEQKWWDSMVTLTSTRKAKYTIEVHEGDKVMELMEKYKEVKDVYHKMMKAADEAGLKADFANGVFVRK